MIKKFTSEDVRHRQRVYWTEGMVLQPEHLYQQEAFLLSINESWMRKLCNTLHGISAIDVDSQSLSRGYFGLNSVSGIFPDGTHFDLPYLGRLPNPIQIPEQDEPIIIALAISANMNPSSALKEEQVLSKDASLDQSYASPNERYEALEVVFSESLESIYEKKVVQVASLCTRLCNINDVGLSEIALPIAKISKINGDKSVELDESFIPPLLDLRANKYLRLELEGLISLIQYRADWQISRLNQPQTTSAFETSDFMLLQVLLRSEANLRLMLAQAPASPLGVYQLLLSMISELGALQYPPHRIDNLVLWTPETAMQAYLQVISQLKQFLSVMRERIAIELNFKINSENTFVTQHPLPQFDLRSRIILAVHAQVPDDWFWERFNTQVTICSLDRLPERIRLQLTGIPIKHLATTPVELPIQAGWHYYELVSMSDLWYEMIRSLSIGIYISGNWPGLKIRGWILQSHVGQRADT